MSSYSDAGAKDYELPTFFFLKEHYATTGIFESQRPHERCHAFLP
jgi:hypothetical protein